MIGGRCVRQAFGSGTDSITATPQGEATLVPAQVPALAPKMAAAPASAAPSAGGALPDASRDARGQAKASAAAALPISSLETRRSDAFYEVKTSIFNALIDTIDLSQLAQLDTDAAREEIRDIVAEIVAIKNVAMSVAEQEHLVQDICNDVLGYGPLEPLLARDDIADIMVNGATPVFIEVGGKIQLTNIRFRDNAQLMNICQRIVSQVGRRVDESSPICDARLPDGSRVNVIAPPLSIDGPTLTIRKFKKDKLTLEHLVELRLDHARRAPTCCKVIGRCRFNVLDLRRHRLGQDHAAQLPDRATSTRASASSPARTPPNCSCSSRMWCAWRRGRPTSKAAARSPCAISSRTACACGPNGSSSAKCADPEAFDLLQAMNTGHDGSMGTLHANNPREAISRLESMITMGGLRCPRKTIREMIVALGRRDHPGRSACATARAGSPMSPKWWAWKAT